MDEMPDTNGAETIDAPLDFAMTSPSDIAMEDFSEDVMSKEIPSDISFDEPSADIPADETITDDSLSDDIFADLPADETVTEDSLPDDIFADSPADETVTENADDKLFEDITTDEAVTEDSLSDDIFADDEITDDDIPDEISIPKDEPSVFDEDISKPQADEINKANGPISFSGLYDKETELGESAVHEESRKKTTIPMLICIICAVICIIATLILLISAPAKALSRKQKAKDAPKTELVKEEQIQTNETVDSVIVIENAESVTPTVPAPKKNSEKVTYRIKWGDTLWDISNNFYKNPWKFTRIAKYNKITNPDYIISGTVITIPAE
ncbi:MAG: LysM peptidoglycan-binding domain-containing protein [Treponema sp.]|nr:LysM peptidoglycan-binding domain-containing protein [Treponema sp.]